MMRPKKRALNPRRWSIVDAYETRYRSDLGDDMPMTTVTYVNRRTGRVRLRNVYGHCTSALRAAERTVLEAWRD